jgi:hypothetical protein
MSVIAFPPEDTTHTHYARLPPDSFAPQRTKDQGQRTISPKKLAANRANAQKSTGPRTPEGKHRSSQNATTHALTANAIPNYKDDPTYATIRQELEVELAPTSPTQRLLVEELARTTFQLQVLYPLAEHLLLNTPLDNDDDALAASAAGTLPQGPSPTDPRRAAPVIAQHFLQNAPTPLTRLWDYRRRLLSRYQSILRQLPKLKEQWSRQQHEYAIDQQDRRIRQENANEHWAAIDQARQLRPPPSRVQNEPTDDPEPIPEGWFDTDTQDTRADDTAPADRHRFPPPPSHPPTHLPENRACPPPTTTSSNIPNPQISNSPEHSSPRTAFQADG